MQRIVFVLVVVSAVLPCPPQAVYVTFSDSGNYAAQAYQRGMDTYDFTSRVGRILHEWA